MKTYKTLMVTCLGLMASASTLAAWDNGAQNRDYEPANGYYSESYYQGGRVSERNSDYQSMGPYYNNNNQYNNNNSNRNDNNTRRDNMMYRNDPDNHFSQDDGHNRQISMGATTNSGNTATTGTYGASNTGNNTGSSMYNGNSGSMYNSNQGNMNNGSSSMYKSNPGTNSNSGSMYNSNPGMNNNSGSMYNSNPGMNNNSGSMYNNSNPSSNYNQNNQVRPGQMINSTGYISLNETTNNLGDKVRRAIQKDTALSSNARAVLVTADGNGQVTLSGSVPSDAEKSKIESIAKSEGATSVKNNISVNHR